jgi:hypothetical protein
MAWAGALRNIHEADFSFDPALIADERLPTDNHSMKGS